MKDGVAVRNHLPMEPARPPWKRPVLRRALIAVAIAVVGAVGLLGVAFLAWGWRTAPSLEAGVMLPDAAFLSWPEHDDGQIAQPVRTWEDFQPRRAPPSSREAAAPRLRTTKLRHGHACEVIDV